MLFSERWLRTFVDPDLDAEALAHLLTMSGLEVEETRPAAPPTSGVVVAKVLAVEPHPDSDRLRVCRVDAGGDPLTIVCGSPDVAAGMTVPCATVGAMLPGKSIGLATVRGVQSQGMLCSAEELGLAESSEGLLALDDALVPGTPLREALAHDDTLMLLKLTPNRADCLSLLGVAREVAALAGAPLARPDTSPVAPTLPDRLPVVVADSARDLCGRFAGRVIRGVNARARTPDWMVQRLERSGQRSISALVDISNYVMLELGQPTHVFDLARLEAGRLEVRWAREGEQVALLNGSTVEVGPWYGVICDGPRPESLAGVMGGAASAVSLDTQDIYVESAFWWPAAIAGRARRLNFTTEAGHRFERGVDFSATIDALERISRLVIDICGGQPGPVDDQVFDLPARAPVAMRLARCARVAGVAFGADEVAGIFARLGLACVQRGEGERTVFEVTPPAHRFDLAIEEDLIEEVVRVHGFDRLPALPPSVPAWLQARPESRRSPLAVREAMAARDFHEAVNFGFVDRRWERDFCGAGLDGRPEPIALRNPIASPLSVMRTSLIGGLVANVQHNLNRRLSRVRLFELGRVFLRDASVVDGPLAVAGIDQPLRLAAIACGDAEPEQWGARPRAVDFFDLKADLESLLAPRVARYEAAAHPALHPGRSARVWLDGQPVGWIGEVHPRWQQAYELGRSTVVFEVEWAALEAGVLPIVTELSRFPAVRRDLAIVVDRNVASATICETVLAAGLPYVQAFEPFDLYAGPGVGEGKKSLAFRVLLQDTRKTLTDTDVEATLERLVGLIADRHDGRLRQQ